MNVKHFFLSLLIAAFALQASAQRALQREKLLELSAQLKIKSQAEKAEAVRVANEKGWAIRTEDTNGRITELMRLDKYGMPMYYTTYNANGAAVIHSSDLYPGGGAGLSLSGSGQTLGEWDEGKVRATHNELIGRVTQKDGATTYSNHSTHVAGTLIASGVDPAAKGMSYAASLDAYDWDDDRSEMIAAAANGLHVSQHSYGLIAGWAYGHWYSSNAADPNVWHWFGDYTISETENYFWGYYSSEAQYWDYISQISPNYLIVKSAGNDRGEGITSGAHYAFKYSDKTWVASSTSRLKDGGTTGYQSIAHSATSKNVITVGAVSNTTAMSSFSGWGPTDDGRIKPDIVAKGVSVYSSLGNADNSTYASWNGTSMSGPMVSGSIGLLLEHQENLHTGVALRSATMKGLILHTASELGNTGPDYMYGWGLMDTEAAAEVMTNNASNGIHIYENSLNDGASQTFQLKAIGDQPLKATLVWTDAYGDVPTPSLNPTDANLVNDLDMTITAANATISYPYILDPANPSNVATTGDNFRDNVEVIYIASPNTGEIYDLQITHKGSLSGGSQEYTLIVTGNEAFDYTYIIEGSDAANNYTNSDFIAEGNKGKGFNNWYYSNTDGGYFRAAAGEQGFNSATIDTDGNSFGMWANDFSDVGRLLYDDLYDGQSVTFNLAYQWDNGNRGFTLNNGGWGNPEEVFFFNINSGGYTWNGGSAATTEWGGMREYGVAISFTFTQNGSDIDFDIVSPFGGGPAGGGTITNASFDRIKFYVSGAGGGTGANMYFNGLTFSTDIASVPANADAIVKGNLTLDADLVLDNLIIESGNSVTIAPLKNLTVNTNINNKAGTAALVLQSDATGTASLLHNNNNVDMTIQRYITGDEVITNAKYHTVSVPLTQSSNPVSGLFLGSYLYRYDNTIPNYVTMGTSTTTPLPVDQGYLIYYPGANTTYEFAGKANNGSFSTDVTYPPKEYNYNLVPNPYPSAIDWNAASGWTKTNMNNAIYIYNTASSSSGNPVWASYVGTTGTNGGSRYIPGGQAFFVQSNAVPPILNMTNEVRVHHTQPFFKDAEEEVETLRLFAHANEYTDESAICFVEESTTGFDGQYDALKFKNWNEAPNIYSLALGKTELSINSIPYSTETYLMELGFEWNQNGEATIELQGIESFGDWVSILFEDRLTGIRFDLRDQSSYSFQHEAEADPLRFVLHFMGVTAVDELQTSNTDYRIWTAGNQINIANPTTQPALLEVFDLQGRLIYSASLQADKQWTISGLPEAQLLIFRLSNSESVFNQKVLTR